MLDACEKLAQSVEQAQQCTSVQAQLPDSAAGVPLPQQLLLLAGRVDACEEGVKAALVSAEAGGAAAADSQLAATHAMCEAHAVALHHLQSEMTALQLAAAAAAAAAAVAAGHSGSEGALSQQVSGLAGEVEALAQRLAALDERLESANESAHSASEQADSRMSSLAQVRAVMLGHHEGRAELQPPLKAEASPTPMCWWLERASPSSQHLLHVHPIHCRRWLNSSAMLASPQSAQQPPLARMMRRCRSCRLAWTGSQLNWWRPRPRRPVRYLALW